MLALLVACAPCPSFAEMEVVDADGSADDDVLTAARTALDDFAGWTGVEGVCVPSIELVEDLPEPLFAEGDWEIGGQYAGAHAPIRVDWRWNVRSSVLHELCHALDDSSGRVLSEAGVAPSVADSRVYEGEAAVHEDFAQACQEGPHPDIELDAAIGERCGTRSYDEVDDWLAAEVFPAAPRLHLGDEVGLSITSREWETGDLEEVVYDVVGDGRTVRTLSWHPWADTVRLAHWNGDLEPLGETELDANVFWYGTRFMRSDADLFVRWFTWLYRFTPTGLVPVLHANDVSGGIVSGETLYDVDPGEWFADGRSTLTATDLRDGAARGLALPEALATHGVEALWPVSGGIAALGDGTYATYDAASETWTEAPGPRGPRRRIALGDGSELVVIERNGRHVLWTDGETWSLAGESCGAEEGTGWAYATYVPVPAGALGMETEEFPTDTDGDKVGEHTVWTLAIE